MLGRKNKPEKPKIGRPVEYGERFPLGLRVTKEVKKKLTDAANASGRSQSQEAELRLEQTFNATNTLYDALDLAYGKHLTGLLLAMAQAAQITGTRAMTVNEWNFEGCEDWVLDPYAYDQAVKAINSLLEEFRPKGKIEIAPVSDFSRYPSSMYEDLGKGFAADLFARLVQPNDQRADAEIVSAITKRLADLLPKAGKRR
jgi:hypothetical protein